MKITIALNESTSSVVGRVGAALKKTFGVPKKKTRAEELKGIKRATGHKSSAFHGMTQLGVELSEINQKIRFITQGHQKNKELGAKQLVKLRERKVKLEAKMRTAAR